MLIRILFSLPSTHFPIQIRILMCTPYSEVIRNLFKVTKFDMLLQLMEESNSAEQCCIIELWMPTSLSVVGQKLKVPTLNYCALKNELRMFLCLWVHIAGETLIFSRKFLSHEIFLPDFQCELTAIKFPIPWWLLFFLWSFAWDILCWFYYLQWT